MFEIKMPCGKRIDENTRVGDHKIYDKTTEICANPDALALNKTYYFGKDLKNKPLYALIDYDTFRIVRYGMITSTCTAAALGIVSIYIYAKLSKQK
jgi:hypothetical protein